MAWGLVAGAAMSYMAARGGRREAKKQRREMKKQRKLGEKQLSFARDRWNHFRDEYGDLERLVIADAERGVTADVDRVTEEASTDVASRFASERDGAARRRQAFGIDPSSGRAEAEDRRYGIGQATAEASAINQARRQETQRAEDQTRGMRMQLAGQGAQRQDRAAQEIMQAQNSLAQMAGQRANMHGQNAQNLFSQAGYWAGYTADQGFGGGGQQGGGQQGGQQSYGMTQSTSGGAHHSGSAPDDGYRTSGIATNYQQTNAQTGRRYGLNDQSMSYGYA